MIRAAAALIAACSLILATGWAAHDVLRQRQEAAAIAAYEARRARLAEEVRNWQRSPAQGAAAEGSRAEAVRALRLLEELYAQEARLWQYYDAVRQSHQVRTSLADERSELTRRIAEHERRLRELEASTERLRPADAAATNDFSFIPADEAASTHQH